MLDQNIWPDVCKPVDRICRPGDFARRSFRDRMAQWALRAAGRNLKQTRTAAQFVRRCWLYWGCCSDSVSRSPAPGLQASGTENCHAIILPRRASKTRQFIDDFPEAGHRAFEKCDSGILVTQFNNIGLSKTWSWVVHAVIELLLSSACNTTIERGCKGKLLMCSKMRG